MQEYIKQKQGCASSSSYDDTCDLHVDGISKSGDDTGLIMIDDYNCYDDYVDCYDEFDDFEDCYDDHNDDD